MDNNSFYTLDEERRELVANPISVGDGLTVLMQISKKYITGRPEDSGIKVNINLGEIQNITYQMQRKTTADYVPGRKDPHSFSRGHILGNGRMVCPLLDRELISFIFKEIKDNVPDSKIFDMVESDFTFGMPFEVQEEETEIITDDKSELVGGTNAVFVRGKTYIYLDDVPNFDLRIICRADSVKNVIALGETSGEGIDSFEVGNIYENKIRNVQFINDSSGADAVNPIKNQVVDFLILGNTTGWKQLK